MAREIWSTYQDGSNLYGVVRRISDDYSWNGSSFEVWNDSNLSTYAIALTARSGDSYSADWPSAIVAGDYYYRVYVRAGGSPATTDTILKTERGADGLGMYWNGAALTSSSSVTISAYALCSLDEVKLDLGITDSTYDTQLSYFINQCSAMIERYCGGRKFKARDYRERLDALKQNIIVTKQWPILRSPRIAFGMGVAFTVTYTGSGIQASAATYNDQSTATSGGLSIDSISSTGTETKTDLPFATYASASSLVTAINAVSGWSATLAANCPSADLNPLIGGDTLNRTVNFHYPDINQNPYSVKAETGTIQLFGYNFPYPQILAEGRYPLPMPMNAMQAILVKYRAGYETIPDDVNMVAREFVRRVWFNRGKDLSITQISLINFAASYDRSQAWVTERLSMYMDPSRNFI